MDTKAFTSREWVIPSITLYQENGIGKLFEAASDDLDTCMMGLFEGVIGGERSGGHEPKVWF